MKGLIARSIPHSIQQYSGRNIINRKKKLNYIPGYVTCAVEKASLQHIAF